MAIAEDLDLLERSIRQLHIDWEKFFGRVDKKPPNDLKARVEALIRKYANSEIRNNAERFRYQALTSRYSAFNELWMKRLRAVEEGRSPLGGHLPRVPPPAADSAGSAREASAPGAGAPGGFRVKDPQSDAAAVRDLFDRFVEARRSAGETGAVKFESFQKLISQQASRILAEKGAQAVDFRLETKDGKVSLKARAVK